VRFIAAAGVVLIGPGLPFGGRDYDASIVTPGAVAIVGGLILIGLALAVRVLGRIEKALAARPLPHPVLQEEARRSGYRGARSRRSGSHPIPAQAGSLSPLRRRHRLLPLRGCCPEDAALERLREKFPTLVRLEKRAGRRGRRRVAVAQAVGPRR